MLKILIDLYKIKNPYSGLGQFSINFANELKRQLPKKISIDFLIPKNNKLLFIDHNINIVKSSLLKRLFPATNKNYPIWHSLQQFPSFIPNKKSIWILTIHDLNFMIEKKREKKDKYLKKLQNNINQADYITTISNFSKNEIEKHLDIGDKKIHVIYNGVISGVTYKKKQPAFINDEKFFFSIGIFNQKKNFKVLLPIIKYFENYKLIIAGNKDTTYGKEIESDIRELGLTDRVILSGVINDNNKQWLYANCEAMLFPSLAEGFGLPVIEAMSLGKPVFLSKLTSLPEIGGPIAFYFDNFNTKHMVELIKTGLESANSNREEFEKSSMVYAEKFSWKNCVSQYLKLYQEIENTLN